MTELLVYVLSTAAIAVYFGSIAWRNRFALWAKLQGVFIVLYVLCTLAVLVST